MPRTSRSACVALAFVLQACGREAPPTQVPTVRSEGPPSVGAEREPTRGAEPEASAPDEDTRTLAAEYRALRAIPGHFGGGEWNDAVDRAGGRKQVVLAALGERLGDGHSSRAEVEALLGPPDDVLRPGDPLYAAALRDDAPKAVEALVYRWRGMHDFLYFASDGRRVLSSGWWFAWE